ncbi:hypothetical protein V6N13_051520 [Hibiscus sabdariffa]
MNKGEVFKKFQHSFVSACLQKSPEKRASSMELSSHPFIKKFEDKDIDLGGLVDAIGFKFSLKGNKDAESAATLPSSSSNGPLYELSEIMAQLRIKRGLSKHYQGKSRSFTVLASVKSIGDLPKKAISVRSRAKMKPCKSHGWGLDGHHNNKPFSPTAKILKKGSNRFCFVSSSSSLAR